MDVMLSVMGVWALTLVGVLALPMLAFAGATGLHKLRVRRRRKQALRDRLHYLGPNKKGG